MENNTTEYFLGATNSKEKAKIKKWLNEKKIVMEGITLNDMSNSISCLKQIINEEIAYCSKIVKPEINKNLSSALILAKGNKIDKLVDSFNKNNTYNKIQFNENNSVEFNKITTIKKASLEIENFDYECPINLKLIFNTNDGEIFISDIIPFDYNGLYKELVSTEEFSKTKFKVANKNNIYFYTCEYGKDFFVMGKEIKLTKGIDFDFDLDGYLVFIGNRLDSQDLVLMYQPNENAYEILIDKKLISITLSIENDFINFTNSKAKRLVIL